MQIDGQCHCGAIAYRAEVNSNDAYVCHCEDCQTLSGSAFRWAIPVAEEDFELLRGEPKAYVKVGASGRENHQYFCEDCGSAIYAMSPGAKPMIFRLRVGSARQRADLVPRVEYWAASAQPWSCELPDAKRHDAQ
jgi:hypothetical protein